MWSTNRHGVDQPPDFQSAHEPGGDPLLFSSCSGLEKLDPKGAARPRGVLGQAKKRLVSLNEMTPGQTADSSCSRRPRSRSSSHCWTARRRPRCSPSSRSRTRKVIDFSASRFLRFDPENTVARRGSSLGRPPRNKAQITYIYVVDQQDTVRGVVDSKAPGCPTTTKNSRTS